MTRDQHYSGPTDPWFAREIAAFPGAEAIASCMQCGVCSGSCPMGEAMVDPPRRLMAHILAGDRERALQSESIWYCASCFTCSVRCPQGVGVADVMFALRSLYMAQHQNASTAFYNRFTGYVTSNGRVYEAGVAMSAALNNGLASMIRNAPMGLGLMRRGRMPLRPHRIQGAAQVAALAKAVTHRSQRRREEAAR